MFNNNGMGFGFNNPYSGGYGNPYGAYNNPGYIPNYNQQSYLDSENATIYKLVKENIKFKNTENKIYKLHDAKYMFSNNNLDMNIYISIWIKLYDKERFEESCNGIDKFIIIPVLISGVLNKEIYLEKIDLEDCGLDDIDSFVQSIEKEFNIIKIKLI